MAGKIRSLSCGTGNIDSILCTGCVYCTGGEKIFRVKRTIEKMEVIRESELMITSIFHS